MSIKECRALDEIVNATDLDIEESQIQHVLQATEAPKKDYLNEDWHDLGKVLLLPSFGGLPQRVVVVGELCNSSCNREQQQTQNYKYNRTLCIDFWAII
ncbi:Inositol oxygenase 4 [Spatholobus suberectus]|nr:Inositol oxygenase 4 [Spatholobus suberectus]